MKISIITPSYNQGRFIEQTIESVLCQNYADFEYLIIDGGSTDDTIGIIRKYEKDERLKWISEPDKGQSDAINKGIKMAKGEIIAWLNSDDIYDNVEVLQIINNEFEKDKTLGMVYGRCICIDKNGNIFKEFLTKEFDYNKLLNHRILFAQPATFYRKSVVEKVGFLDTDQYLTMDYDLHLKIGKVSRVKYTNHILARFRIHDASKTGIAVVRTRLDTLKVARRHGAMLLSPMLFRYIIETMKDPLLKVRDSAKNILGKLD